jgi:hypothetical protein
VNDFDLGQAAEELDSLRRLALQRLAVALGAVLMAAPAALLDVRLAVAFGAGAVFEAFLALTSSAQRRAILASLAVHGEAYLLPEVQRYGIKLSRMESRRALARSIVALLRTTSESRVGVALVDRVAWQAPALAALAQALIEPRNAVQPTAIAACSLLLTDGRMSPLLNPSLPRAELDAMLCRIHAGIAPQEPADAPARLGDRSRAA